MKPVEIFGGLVAASMLGFIAYDGVDKGYIGLPEAKEAADTCDAQYIVGIRVKEAVRDTLHDPGSLRNWQMDQFPLDGPDCFYRAQGTFTATNAFGGRVQGSFVADVLAQGLTAQVVGLEVR